MKTITLEVPPGNEIREVCRNAIDLARRRKCQVRFIFNDTEVIASSTDTISALVLDWDTRYKEAAEAYRNSKEYKDREAARAAEYKAKCEAVMVEKATTEPEMRAAKVPWPYTEKQLHEYIESLVKRNHDYGTCCYAMSMAAMAAFNYVAHQLGVTGFQSSCADLDFFRRSRSIDGPFIILKGEDVLYPQYDLPGKLEEALNEWQPWLKEQATKKLFENGDASERVRRHWQRIAQ